MTLHKIIFFSITLLVLSCNKNYKEVDVSTFTKQQRMNLVKEGNQSPNGTILAIDNSSIKINSFEGKLTVIDFWATWCAPCIKEAPLFKKLDEKYKDSTIDFISISIDDEFSTWQNFIEKNKWSGNNYWLGLKEEAAFFSFIFSKHVSDNHEMILIGLPKYVILSPTGEILSNSDLRPSKPALEEAIKKYVEMYP